MNSTKRSEVPTWQWTPLINLFLCSLLMYEVWWYFQYLHPHHTLLTIPLAFFRALLPFVLGAFFGDVFIPLIKNVISHQPIGAHDRPPVRRGGSRRAIVMTCLVAGSYVAVNYAFPPTLILVYNSSAPDDVPPGVEIGPSNVDNLSHDDQQTVFRISYTRLAEAGNPYVVSGGLYRVMVVPQSHSRPIVPFYRHRIVDLNRFVVDRKLHVFVGREQWSTHLAEFATDRDKTLAEQCTGSRLMSSLQGDGIRCARLLRDIFRNMAMTTEWVIAKPEAPIVAHLESCYEFEYKLKMNDNKPVELNLSRQREKDGRSAICTKTAVVEAEVRVGELQDDVLWSAAENAVVAFRP